jgi:hypothetical protein
LVVKAFEVTDEDENLDKDKSQNDRLSQFRGKRFVDCIK